MAIIRDGENIYSPSLKILSNNRQDHKANSLLARLVILFQFYSRDSKIVQAFFALSRNFFHVDIQGNHPGQS